MDNEYHKGKLPTESARENMRQAHASERKPVRRVSVDGQVVEYPCLGDVAIDVGGYKSNITRAIKNSSMYKGFRWERVERG